MGRRKNTAEAYEILYRIARERLGEAADGSVRPQAPGTEPSRPVSAEAAPAPAPSPALPSQSRAPSREGRSPSAWIERAGAFSPSPLSPKPRTRPRGLVPQAPRESARGGAPARAPEGPEAFVRPELVSRPSSLVRPEPVIAREPQPVVDSTHAVGDARIPLPVGRARFGGVWADFLGGGIGGAAAEDDESPPGDEEGADGNGGVGRGGDRGEGGERCRGTRDGSAGDGSNRERRPPHSDREREDDGGEPEQRSDELAENTTRDGETVPRTLTAQALAQGATLSRAALALAGRGVVWIAGEKGSRALARRVEVRVSTLLMATISLVIGLALVGIYINVMLARRDFENPFIVDERARAELDQAFSSNGGAILAIEDVPPAVAFRPRRATTSDEPIDRDRPWVAGPENGLGPELRREEVRPVAPLPSSQPDLVFNPKRHWIQMRGAMDDRERDELFEHVTQVILPFFAAYVSPSTADASMAYKEVVWTPMPERPHLYYLYVGPFRTASDALVAKKNFETELKSYPQLGFKSYFSDLLARPESPTISEYRRRAHSADATDGRPLWAGSEPPTGPSGPVRHDG